MSLLFKSGEDWTFDLIEKVWSEIQIIGRDELRLEWYPAQIEIVSAEQMLDAYSSIGMPVYYKHWSFGKDFVMNKKNYDQGMSLAYELVINSNPCIAYLMEENDMTMQTLVLAHASVGHSAVFKNNYLFKDNTHADSIVDYLNFAKNYIHKCEEKYGEDEVEAVIDACHALSNYGVDKFKRPKKLRVKDEEKEAWEKFEKELSDYNPMWEKLIKKHKNLVKKERFPKEPEENLLYFIEKNAPLLPQWKREIIRIVRKISQYFYPQTQTKVLNEGFASFTHYYIVTRLFEKGLIDEGSYMSFLKSHTGVLKQLDYDHKYFSGINPYALGFAIFKDIKRMCEEPTEEDRRYFPDLVGKDWVDEIKYAMVNFKDDSFIAQYLSPTVVKEFKLFHVEHKNGRQHYRVQNIQDQTGFYALREKLSKQYHRGAMVPEIRIVNVNLSGDRCLEMDHEPLNHSPLDEISAETTLAHVAALWEFPVELRTIEWLMTSKVAKTFRNYGKYGQPEEIKNPGIIMDF
jgi:stage V sporulation protein R